ncbi:MAG: SUMF1/EgtB/PvdO family nonheme iron enzyme [Planctomycetota bacterium]|nr:SUMF1/EgtB/PvdO family nonheme iron enzyme [Planctomycetota bacterium]
MSRAEIGEYPQAAVRRSSVTRIGALTTWATSALLASLLAACSHLPLSDGTEIVVDNPTGADLWLHRAKRDGWDPPRALGSARAHHLRLSIGRYALSDRPERQSVPLPVLPAELGYEPQPMRATFLPPPPPEPGWRWIPAGPFLLGDRLGVGQEDERPVRTPETAGFWLAAHETTNAQYAQFLNALPKDRVDASWLDFGGRKCRVRLDEESGRYVTDAPTLPVVTVSAAGADAYCRWRTDATDVPHRLPTEAEWEKAARGPGSRVYAYGDTCATLHANQESGALAPVGGYAPNGFGLYDMTGNAFEWTADVYVSGRARDPDAGKFRALRGGSFLLDGVFVRNAMRMRLRPSVRADDVGFRVLRANSAR